VELLGYGYSNGTARGLQPLFLTSKVGIGASMSNPQYQCEVNGSLNATTLYEGSNSIITKYTLSNTFSNAQSNFASYSNWCQSNYLGYSNYITPKLIWTSNSLSNFSTDSNGDQSITIINNTSCNIVQQVSGKSSTGGDFLKWLFSSIGSAVVSTTITLAANNLSIGEKTIMEWGAEGFRLLQNSLTGAVMNASCNLLQGFKTFRTVGGKDFLTISPEEKVSLLADYAKWGPSSVTINGDSNTIIITDSNTNSNVYLGLDKCYMMSNVGVGYSNPAYNLSVNGIIYGASNIYEGGTLLNTRYASSNAMSNWNFGSNTAMWCSNNTSNLPLLYASSNAMSNWNFGSNTAYYGSNVAYWCSNNHIQTSTANTTYSLSNNNSNWDWASNNASWNSNLVVATSNAFYSTSNSTADRYWTANSLSNIYTNSNVGLGTSTPSYKLDVVGTGKFSSNLTVNQLWLSDKALYFRTGTDTNHGLIYAASPIDGPRLFGYTGGVLSATGASNGLWWRRNGSVGIGNAMSNPSYPLDVSGIANATTLYENATSLITKYSLSNNNSNWDFGSNTASWCSNLVSASYADKYWTVNGTNVYTYSNVGIGTNSPSTKLQINTTSISGGFLVNSGSNNTTAIKATSSGAGWGSGIVLANTSASGTEFGIYSGSDGSLHFANNQIVSDFMVVNQNNLIGIGTTPSTYNVSIGGVLNVTTGYYKNGTSLDSVYALSNHTHPIPYWAVGSSSNAYGTIYTNSNLGIGTNSTSYYRLDVNGAARVSGDLEITNRSQTLYIQPGLKQSTATSGYCQYDLPSSGVHYYWDDMTCTGTITAAYKSFVIPHPLDRENKVLIHSCVEAPRADLMYSGVAHLKDGKVEVNIDTESCPNNPMTHGTFETLTRNPRVSLQNMTSFDRVKASIQGGTLTIECESLQSDDEIHWFVVAERRDEGIIKSDNAFTCEKGYLLTEKPKHMVMLDEADRPSRRKKDK
jgi:hypothetical protein